MAPASYTPAHLAERIINSKASLEGERKHVTVLFADLKGSMELLADRDPEEVRTILDPVLQLMMEAAHVARDAVDLIAGELAETAASLRLLGDVPVPERVQRQGRAVKRLAVVLRHAAEQFKATAEAIDVWAGRRSG